MNGDHNHKRAWWKEATFYQIYPASFLDTTGSGTGDLKGILAKLDYLKSLGIDAIWISPFFDSPQVDMGYDISNYEDVYPPFGTVADVEAILERAHSLGIKVIIDLVINHTSDQHQWFLESRSSKEASKRNWYIWRPPKIDKDGKRQPPNNWRGNFNQSVWEWDEHTQEYYLHLFAIEQPDLNWDNEECRAAIYQSSMTFWLEKGVDGFRIDTANMYDKSNLSKGDAPVVLPNDPFQPSADLFCNGPKMPGYFREMAKVFDRYDAMSVGELPNTPKPEDVRKYVSASDPQMSMVFQFDVVDIDIGSNQKFEVHPWQLTDLKNIFSKWQSFIERTDAWTTVFFENHDQPRSVSRYANDSPEHRVQSAKMLALMACAMTGTLFIYQGQEIGTINCPADWPLDEFIDIEAVNYLALLKEKLGGDEAALEAAMKVAQKGIHQVGRDNARCPMQWDDSTNAGFSSGQSWHRVHDEYKTINVAAQVNDSSSVLSFWRDMIKLRKQHKDIFIYGDFAILDAKNQETLTFVKSNKSERVLVVCNFSTNSQPFDHAASVDGKLSLLAATGSIKDENNLAPFEARIYTVD